MNQEKTGILLVDDDHAVRSFARIILEHEGWQVEEAGSLQEAFDQVRSCGFRPHVSVVDILLPDGVGTELVEDLRQARPKSKVIYITGDPGWLRRLSAQVGAVLAKPFTPVQLVVAVRAALETMRPVVVIVESGRVYQRLIGSALEQESVKLATASSFDEGLRLASETGAAVLFTPEPEEDGALARLLDLRREMPALAVVALASDGPRSAASWYDRRLIPPYSAQSVGDTILHVLNLKSQIESTPSEWAYAHKNGSGKNGH
jgi:DNA-binding response OmpR family regulator